MLLVLKWLMDEEDLFIVWKALGGVVVVVVVTLLLHEIRFAGEMLEISFNLGVALVAVAAAFPSNLGL